MAATQTQQAPVQTVLVEERFFAMPLERAQPLVESALAASFGAPLEPLAAGMWTAQKSVGRGVTVELTARAMEAEGGTTVELRYEHRVSPLVSALTFTGVIVMAMLVVPLFVYIAYAQEAVRGQQRDRLVMMHRAWTELSSSLGPPRAQGYRGQREAVRVRVDEAEEHALEEPASGATGSEQVR